MQSFYSLVLVNSCAKFTKTGDFVRNWLFFVNCMLTLRNAYVEATGSNGSVCDLHDLILDGCSITQPTGAAFDANVHAVALNGKVVTDKVVIEPVANGISDITTDVPAYAKGIYSVTGVKQTQQWNELPAGIYIVDGVKRVKR